MPRKKKQKIALCMIVKNEAHVIQRALYSVSGVVDHYYICDTGSSDGTQDIIKDWLKTNKKKGRVVDKPWVDFAHNRNDAFALAKNKCDYIMTLDADEVLLPLKDNKPDHEGLLESFPEFIAEQVDAMCHFGNAQYLRPLLFKGDVDWVWTSPMHESCSKQEGTPTKELIEGVCNYPRAEGSRSKDSRKSFKDALVLEKHLLDNPNHCRSLFYLGQCYYDDKKFERAMEAMESALKLSVWEEEQYVLYLRMARCCQNLPSKEDEAVSYYLKAYDVFPKRPEAMYELLEYYRKKSLFSVANIYGELALELSRQKEGILFLESSVYDWRILDSLALSYFYGGRVKDCLKLCSTLQTKAPESEKKRIAKNLDGFRKGLKV